jgi:hypothetical protein
MRELKRVTPHFLISGRVSSVSVLGSAMIILTSFIDFSNLELCHQSDVYSE